MVPEWEKIMKAYEGMVEKPVIETTKTPLRSYCRILTPNMKKALNLCFQQSHPHILLLARH